MVQQSTFCDKIGREASALEEGLVLEGVVQLAVGHASTLEPAIENVLHSAEQPLALTAGDCQVVNLVSMQVSDLRHQDAFEHTMVEGSICFSLPFSLFHRQTCVS